MKAVALGFAWALTAIPVFGQTQKAEPAKPEYFDEPTFIVAGVADPTQRGGHGSDPVLRSADTLAKATASLRTGPSDAANEALLREAMAREPNRADLHHSLADVEERLGNALAAVREYQRTVELDPSEANLFDWGTELLTHRAAEQAAEVFTRGIHSFPHSTRTLLGLAVALYSRGCYDDAAKGFFEAADLDPNDPEPYMFLGKLSIGTITESAGFRERMERFAKLHPDNAWANYYYAVSLRKRSQERESRALLEKAAHLDPQLGAAFLELGIIFADRGNFPKAIAAYESAISASPSLEEAHYRLALAYRKAGETVKSQKEIDIYQKLERESAQASERERSEIQQFVFALKDKDPEQH